MEAQSVANCYTAIEQGLEVVPVLNKIDLPSLNPTGKAEIEEVIGIPADDALMISAKTGLGVEDVLEQLVLKVPPPEGNTDGPLQALIIDSWFDSYLGVVSLVRIVHGSIRKKQKITIMSTGKSFMAENVGVFTPKRLEKDILNTGEVGYVVAGIKDIFGAPVGDTITWTDNPAAEQLTGFNRCSRACLPVCIRLVPTITKICAKL